MRVGWVLLGGCAGADVHVHAQLGDDGADGSADAPLRTLHAAQAAARRAGQPVTVHVRGSHALGETLALTEEDSGTRWSGDGEAAVHGGVQVPVSLFKPWKGSILQANLTGLGIQLGELSGTPGLGQCQNRKSDLYLNSAKMTLARYPNVGSDGLWQFLLAEEGTSAGTGLTFPSNLSARAGNWSQEKDLWLHGYWKFDWADGYVRVAGVDATNRSLNFDPKTPPVYNVVMKNARFYLVNALSELDSDGEYYVDRAEQVLYFQPPGGKLAATDSVVLSNLTTVISATGGVGVHLEGLQVQFGSGMNVEWKNMTDSSIVGCQLGATGGQALVAQGKRLVVRNNTAVDMGCKGFSIDGGDLTTLERGEILVENNHIERFSQWVRTYNPGLGWAGVGNTYRGNVVRDGPHTAMQGGGNDNVFDGNTIDRLAYEVDDTGAWYAGRSWAKRNNTLINNLFSNVQNLVKTYLGAPSVQAIYNDDQLSDNTFINNTFVNCHCGLFIGGGRRHVARGNKFINTTTPVHVDDRGLNWQKEYCQAPDGHFWTELQSLKYTQPPYSAHYPELLSIDHPCVPVHNVIEGNTFCGSDSGKFTDFTAAQAASWNLTLTNNVEKPEDCGAAPRLVLV